MAPDFAVGDFRNEAFADTKEGGYLPEFPLFICMYLAYLAYLGFWVVSLNSRDEVLSAEFHKIRGSQRTQVP